jgi:hypothetical protein
MPWVGFESTIPASEWAKTVHALDRSATVTGWKFKLGNAESQESVSIAYFMYRVMIRERDFKL